MKSFSPSSLFTIKRTALVGSVVASCAFATVASGGSPRLSSFYPSGGQRGAEIEIECKGGNLADATGLLFDAPGFEVAVGAVEKDKFKVKVKVSADARLGEHTARVVTSSGLSDVRLFYVSPFPMVLEDESKEAPEKAQPVPFGVTIYGRTQGEDVDRFEIEAKRGDRITAEVIGARLQTQSIYDPAVTISKPDGSLLIAADDGAFTRQDPVTSVVAPEDGKYVIAVKESTNSGQGDCHYLLNIGSFPRPLAVYPPGGRAGEELKVQLLGDARGVIEKTIKLPDQAIEKFQIFAEEGQTAPQPNFVRVSMFANALEVEPNDEITKASPAEGALPLALNGVVGAKGDVDYFKFTAKKGLDYDVNVFARRLRSPLDSIAEIYNLKGDRLATNDDAGSPDSYQRWKAPEDGEFYLSVRDQLYRGGQLFTYRVEIQPVQPMITAWLPEMVQNSNQERRAIVVPKGNRYASLVRIKRADVGGDIQVAPRDVPEGVEVTIPSIDKSVDTIPVVFEAKAEAPSAAKTFGLDTTLSEPPKDVTILSRIEHDVDVAENGNQKSFYSIREDRLPIQVSEAVPVKIALAQPKVAILQNGSMNLKVTAERQGDFKGPISLALLYSPPGIGTAGTLQIKEGENEAAVTISAAGDAALRKWKVCVVGSADFGKGPVWISTQMVELEVAAPFIAGSIVRTFVDQADSTTITVKLDQKLAFDGKAKISLMGLPAGCTSDEREVSKDDKEIQFTVKAGSDSPAGQHKQLFCQFRLEKDGEPMTSTFGNGGILRIDKASVAKK